MKISRKLAQQRNTKKYKKIIEIKLANLNTTLKDDDGIICKSLFVDICYMIDELADYIRTQTLL